MQWRRKTTAAYDLLPEVFKAIEFVNADEIARGLSPFNPSGVALRAGRIVLERIKQLMEKSESFALAIERVVIRVSKGGHSIPADVVERPYHKGLKNFSRYAAVANEWYVYDNSGSGYSLVASSANNIREIITFELFKIISGDK